MCFYSLTKRKICKLYCSVKNHLEHHRIQSLKNMRTAYNSPMPFRPVEHNSHDNAGTFVKTGWTRHVTSCTVYEISFAMFRISHHLLIRC